MRMYLLAAVMMASVVAIAPAVSAGGSTWGKGVLTETLEFSQGSGNAIGYLYWSPETTDFVYNFHGYYLEEDTLYTLICFEGDQEPQQFLSLGAKYPCTEINEGVHMKGIVPWPEWDEGATICLVPDTWEGLGGSEPWTPEDYLMPAELIEL